MRGNWYGTEIDFQPYYPVQYHLRQLHYLDLRRSKKLQHALYALALHMASERRYRFLGIAGEHPYVRSYVGMMRLIPKIVVFHDR